MRFMILVKATVDSEAGRMPTEALFREMGAYHQELAEAGVLVDASGLQRSEKGWRIQYARGERPSLVDGPFTETKELVAGYTIINVKSREEAIEWTRRFPNPSIDGGDAQIEVRQFFEMEDFAGLPGIEAFDELKTTA
jgi:hypothetical protein